MKIQFRIERRQQISLWLNLLVVAGALVIGLLISAILIRASGANVLDAYKALLVGAFGSKDAILESIVQGTPLIFTGLAMVVAFRSKVINLGAEGQFLAGAMAGAWISMNYSNLPNLVLIPLLALGGMAAGAAWGLFPAILKAKLETSEVISTVLLNYVILYYLSYLLSGPWRPPSEYLMQTHRFEASTYWPSFFESRLHLGFFIGLVIAGLLLYIIQKTPFGFELRSVGENRVAARYKGINIERTIILAMVLSGGLAGLAGAGELSGLHHRLMFAGISKGYGWTGILIALLGQLNPLGVIISSILFGGLINGSVAMKIHTGVPIALVESFQGIIMFVLLSVQAMIQFRIRRIKDSE